ncbi:hypothetical protein ATE92_0770 [Ulvibacter sp. MAR_2010_11]|uniref:hypothetical protein n=1 Tax=Ulvibacter sp. MAR_2010_11 TaxID=1250229 RepID=UPI000C2C7557|nr:hypothetical protein [Ulvibacter sp. MAR_2010_11]PKA82634.1 hypothetical protein ATE92_0770 [Ulvibacter sp. MAR_2010_11]
MGKILIYDDEEPIVRKIKSAIRGLNLGLKPIVFVSLEDLRDYIYSDDNWDEVKAVVFDLAQKKEEDAGIIDFEILEDIKYCVENRRVPILIHSAYANQLDVLATYPSVLLYKKSGKSIKNVRNDIGLMERTGFLNLFSEGPLLKDELMLCEPKLNWGDLLVKRVLQEHFIDNFKGVNILEQLSEIIQLDNPQRETYLKYLKPAVDSLKATAKD